MASSKYFLHPGVRPSLKPSVLALSAAVLAAILAGIAGLAATIGTIRLIAGGESRLVTAVLATWLVAAIASAFSSWLAHAAEGRFEARLRREVAKHLLRLPADRLSNYSADRLRRLVSDDIAALHHMIAHLPAEIATMIVLPLCATIALLTMAGPMALLALIPGTLAAIAYLIVLPKLSAAHGAERARVMTEITTAVDDYARGIHVFRSFGAERGALEKYQRASTDFTTDMVAWVKRVATPAAIAVALLQAVASYAIAYTVGVQQDTATLAAMLLLSLALVTPALRLGHGLDFVAAGRGAAARIGELLAEPQLAIGSAELQAGPLGLSVQGLTVRANTAEPSAEQHRIENTETREIFEPFDLVAKPGTLTAITGPSGAGKSTVLRVLAGYQGATRGSVRLASPNGQTQELSDLSESARERAILYVPQGLAVLSATVRENLLLIDPEADDEACAEALRRARLNVQLDDDASVFSGGERQRLSLARAFLSSARVLLLDEPSSALNSELSAQIWAEFRMLARDKSCTVVVVTHDSELAQQADQLLSVEPAQEGSLR
ncbi:ABC transporter ATP-binding protein [Leucobacter sp. UT-8R-CII-1-4]|uniref:ATP-binding cassette domain-containing protein n=1 Tax=Leucobacter sp. UT-8R-CII-1-4 TaxID=3040075 RepID=UPI0024A98789|nr:ABC transporter ATP-binding protein [Leucobacter sp. UT-8R-CII-1-4]MDI6022180.1 ABC transporter ATP-binding protein [Leucobacter sp. UT-8R-CII-1-4]